MLRQRNRQRIQSVLGTHSHAEANACHDTQSRQLTHRDVGQAGVLTCQGTRGANFKGCNASSVCRECELVRYTAHLCRSRTGGNPDASDHLAIEFHVVGSNVDGRKEVCLKLAVTSAHAAHDVASMHVGRDGRSLGLVGGKRRSHRRPSNVENLREGPIGRVVTEQKLLCKLHVDTGIAVVQAVVWWCKESYQALQWCKESCQALQWRKESCQALQWCKESCQAVWRCKEL
jgi:hypothetical protein